MRSVSGTTLEPADDCERNRPIRPGIARRVAFRSGEHERIVWFGSQGQVLRVEVPSLGYVAERQDLVG